MTETLLKLEKPEDLTFERIPEIVSRGGKFVVYEYLFPRPLFAPVKRISRVYFLNPGEDAGKYAFRYNLATLLLGWWGLPFGPYYTLLTLKLNKTGVDLTDDVLANLTASDFEQGRINLKKLSTAILPPDKSSIKAFTKCFKSFHEKNTPLASNPFVGNYIDTEHPYFIIGLSGHDTVQTEQLKKALYKHFYTHVTFEFIQLNEGGELAEQLKLQGVEIAVITPKI